MSILNLPGWIVLEVRQNGKDYRITATHDQPPRACYACGTVGALVKWDHRERLYMDVPVHTNRVGIALIQQRYKCRSCQAVRWELLPEMDERHRLTRRLVGYIVGEGLVRTFTGIARETGLNESTVRRMFNDYYQALDEQRVVLAPRWLGIDEIHLTHQARCVLTNLQERRILDVLKNRNKPTVSNYLSRLPGHKTVEVVCIDMWSCTGYPRHPSGIGRHDGIVAESTVPYNPGRAGRIAARRHLAITLLP